MVRGSAILFALALAAGTAEASLSADTITETSETVTTTSSSSASQVLYSESWVCDECCWNTEDDEPFLHNPDYMGCMQIYGHREWKDGLWITEGGDCPTCTDWCNCRYCGADDGCLPDGSSNAASDVNIYFSVPAFVVLFRESLEVVLVLVIILQFLQKSRNNESITAEQHTTFRREVYAGAGIGFLACVALGVGILVLISFALQDVKGETHLILEGTLMLITSCILSFMAVNFYKMMYAKEAHERKLAKHMETALEAAQEGSGAFAKKHTFFMFAFMTGLREGLESILFLSAIVVDAKDLTSLPIPIISAIVLARVVGWCFFTGTSRMPVAVFMKCSAAILLFIAAGFFSSATHNFQELGVFGTWNPKAERPWQNTRLYDARECCDDMTNRFWVFMRAMFGWQDQATPLEFFAYGTYWMLAIILGGLLLRRAKKQIERMKESWRQADEQKAIDAGESGQTSNDAPPEFTAPAK